MGVCALGKPKNKLGFPITVEVGNSKLTFFLETIIYMFIEIKIFWNLTKQAKNVCTRRNFQVSIAMFDCWHISCFLVGLWLGPIEAIVSNQYSPIFYTV